MAKSTNIVTDLLGRRVKATFKYEGTDKDHPQDNYPWLWFKDKSDAGTIEAVYKDRDGNVVFMISSDRSGELIEIDFSRVNLLPRAPAPAPL